MHVERLKTLPPTHFISSSMPSSWCIQPAPTGVTEKLFMCQMFICLFWPLSHFVTNGIFRRPLLRMTASQSLLKRRFHRKGSFFHTVKGPRAPPPPKFIIDTLPSPPPPSPGSLLGFSVKTRPPKPRPPPLNPPIPLLRDPFTMKKWPLFDENAFQPISFLGIGQQSREGGFYKVVFVQKISAFLGCGSLCATCTAGSTSLGFCLSCWP